jgi:hypothetical protein
MQCDTEMLALGARIVNIGSMAIPYADPAPAIIERTQKAWPFSSSESARISALGCPFGGASWTTSWAFFLHRLQEIKASWSNEGR